MKRLNNDEKFINNITPEREVVLIENTMKKFAREEGRAEGEAIGEASATLNIATNMLENNYPINEIAKMTGLSIEEIKNIKL